MRKSIEYPRTKFAPEVIQEATATLSRLAVPSGKVVTKFHSLRVAIDDARWTHDNVEEFFSDYRRTSGTANIGVWLMERVRI